MPNPSQPWLTGIDTIDPTYYTPGMVMGRRKDRARTPGLWIAANEVPPTEHPFYQRLNQVLEAHAFDDFVEAQCAPFYATTIGRPSLTPGTYFRLLLIGYFEGSIRSVGSRGAPRIRSRCVAFWAWPGRNPTRALDDLADPAPHRSGDAPRGLHVDPAGPGDGGSHQGDDHPAPSRRNMSAGIASG